MTTEDIADIDRAALQRCMDMAMRDPAFAKQLQEKLDQGDWWGAHQLACYSLQIDNLHLKPWQNPPMELLCEQGNGADPQPQDRMAFKVLQKLQRAGLSAYEPDPLIALAGCKKIRRK